VLELLRFLITRFGYLFEPDRYRFVDSNSDRSFGDDAVVLLESEILRLRFSRDRSQLLLEFQPIQGRKDEWFSPGLLRGLLTGERGGSEVLSDEWASYLEPALDELEVRLKNPATHDATIAGLREQAKARAKELFG
jgi:hypothetical protein